MTLGLVVIGGSATLLAILTVLFNAEFARGERVFLSGLRASLDRVVTWSARKIQKFFSYLGAGSLRAIYHYVIHRLLSSFINVLTRAQARLYELQRRNKRTAKVIKANEGTTHLDAMVAHKAETELSEEEKRQRRSH